MAGKKRLSKKEKDALTKKALIIAAIVFAAAAIAAVIAGVIVHTVEERRAERQETAEKEIADAKRQKALSLRADMESACRADPWIADDPAAIDKKEGEFWAYYEMLMAIEDDALRTGSNGVEYDRSVGDVLCVDFSPVENEATRAALERMFQDYCALKDLNFRTGTKEQLRAEGKMSAAPYDRYSEGCFLRIGKAAYDQDSGRYISTFSFEYGYDHLRAPEICAVRRENYRGNPAEYGAQTGTEASLDENWAAFILGVMQS